VSEGGGPALDDEVVRRAREGDRDAFGRLWSELSPAIRAFVWSRGAHEPEDVTSEVFLSFFRALASCGGGLDEARALLFTIAHRRVADEFRARSRRPLTASWSAQDDVRTTVSAERRALASLAGETAMRALESLTEDQRQVITLRIYGDLTLEQIASVVGKRLPAVKALNHRGMQTLRRRAEELGLTQSHDEGDRA